MQQPLPDDLLEEVLRRLPPHEPAELVRAALVCKQWCRLVSDPGFRRRFREFRRSPPMLGMLCDTYSGIDTARFIPTTAFCTPRTDFRGMRVLDARHGRVLFAKGRRVLAVWDPIMNEVRELPFPARKSKWYCRTAAILCSAAAGACNHLDCHHHGPFLIVFVCTNSYANPVVYTYSSDAAAWSEPVTGQGLIICPMASALVGNAVYFQFYDLTGSTTLEYNFESHQMSMIQLPPALSMLSLEEAPLLTTMEDGGLGFINKDDSKLCLWSRKDTHEVDAIWERRVIIELKAVFPVDVDVTKLGVIGSDVGIILMNIGNEVYTIDLKTYKVKKVYQGKAHKVIPYMSFYTPAFGGTCTGEGPSASCSSA